MSNIHDTTHLVIQGHEGWMEFRSSHGHHGSPVEVLFKWGDRMKSDGSDLGTPPVFHDLYCPANPETSRSGLAFKFTYISGTSIAAPHVAGVAALLYGKNPHKAPPTIRQELLKSAQPLPELKGKIQSGGIVDAYAALNQTGKRK